MNSRFLIIRTAVGLAGGALLLGFASTAMAAEYDSDGVDVNVRIAPLNGGGALSMTIAGTSTALTEDGSDGDRRQFLGALPTVTVSDTRDAEDIPDGAAWYVTGIASDFTTTDGKVIGAEHLGWTPRILSGNDSGLVTEGEQVDTILDEGPDNTGLDGDEFGGELFALAADSADARSDGSWTATADLFLRTPVDVDAGDYSSTLTLSLFE